eukprot:CAMPEP_0176014604 /NCGR_PEP_ID=MMETSP0120_2-20121206/6909_1 /TAXON_ID=160619 /ORGANISM="Kryptoperidinium foliaceum, Strain CCMP 1326" /LENGTH=500 /DNA_ID=CAMNT_0017347551 /DNA_START=249 /DNA_END=1748 /DNA_ORIENTATION=-
MPRVASAGTSQSYLPTNGVDQAPSSAASLPRIRSSPKTPIPAPHSFRATSMFTPRSSNMVSPRMSPARPVDLPRVQSDVSPVPPPPQGTAVKASEHGSGTLLPDFNHSSHVQTGPRSRTPPNRFATRSSPSLKQIMKLGQGRQNSREALPQTQQDVAPRQTIMQAAKQSLRRRTYSSAHSDDEDYVSQRGGSSVSESPYRSRRGGKRAAVLNQLQKLSRMKLGHILQVIIVLAVTALVWESHHKALYAAQQLSQFKEEESLLLLHLQKIEQQSIQLHETIGRLAEAGVKNSPEGGDKKGVDVDYELIHKQTQQLYQMEEELNNEVRTLQTRIQQSARSHIIQEFGEGPVQVVLELDFGTGQAGQIVILLWHDTPHAAWTWLDQILRHVWDGAQFDWQQGHIIDALPPKEDPTGGKIEFVEQSQHGHEAWTVGLRETDTGMMTMYVNLQDNSNIHKHETCVGKVVDGFDSLKRLLEVARKEEGEAKSVVTVRKATATHVTK